MEAFKDPNGQQYFKDRRNLAGIFNIDWFQPFEGSEHSLGAMYLVLLNLPREMRFKKENILLVGLIPGPHEPELNVNTYLTPFVNELLQFWKGVHLYEDNDLTLYRFVLLCISSDLPATRKCCGFLSYNAKKGIFFSFKSKFLNLHKTLKKQFVYLGFLHYLCFKRRIIFWLDLEMKSHVGSARCLSPSFC